MSLLEKLRITSEEDDEFVSDLDGDFRSDYDDDGTGPVPPDEDDPRRDPAPGERPATPRAKAAPRRSRAEPPRVTKKHKEEAAEELETLISALAMVWGLQAPPCGDALEEAAPDLSEKVVKLVARNPKWLLRVREGGMIADALGIAMALKPVVQVAYRHYSQPGEVPGGGVVFDPERFAPYAPGA